LLGIFAKNELIALYLLFSIFLSAVFSFWIAVRLCYGPSFQGKINYAEDLSPGEQLILFSLIFSSFLLGLHPESFYKLLVRDSFVKHLLYNAPL